MKTRMVSCLILIPVLLFCLAEATDAAGKGGGKVRVDDFEMRPIPKIPRPEKGKPFLDPVTGMKITRVTDPDKDGYGGRRRAFAGYPKHSIENCDSSYLVLSVSGKGMSLWDATTFKFIKSLAGSGNSRPTSEEMRWDGRDPKIIYYSGGHGGGATKLYKQNVDTGTITVLHDFKAEFPDALKVCTDEEGDSSADSRYWGFKVKKAGRAMAAVTYDKDADGRDKGKVIGKLDSARGDWIGMSPSGKYIMFGESGTYADREFKKVMKHTNTTLGHADLMIDDEGNEGIVGWGGARLINLETGKGSMYPRERPPYRPYRSYHKINGKPASSFGSHISGNNYGTPGWALMSTYNKKTTDQLIYYPEQCVFLVEMTHRKKPAPRIIRVAYHRSIYGGYGDNPFAKTNMAGTRVFFGSNWETPRKGAGHSHDVYCVDLPEGWYEQVMGKAKAKKLREKVAKLTRLTVDELCGKKK